jgi:uncharacterized protein (TIGR03435 family)
MLQNLLIDRFQLKFHWENKLGHVYVLVRGKKNLKLQPAKHKNDYPFLQTTGISIRAYLHRSARLDSNLKRLRVL